MAKKIAESSPHDAYPWLRLLELEVQPSEPRPSLPRGRGRPRNTFPRQSVHVTLTDDELAALDALTEQLSARFGRMHRGHLIAFLVFYLRGRLETYPGLPPEVRSLTDLALYLDKEK